MSIRKQALIEEAPGVVGNGKSHTNTKTDITVSARSDVITLKMLARKPAAHDTEVVSKLSLEEARDLRDELQKQIEARED